MHVYKRYVFLSEVKRLVKVDIPLCFEMVMPSLNYII